MGKNLKTWKQECVSNYLGTVSKLSVSLVLAVDTFAPELFALPSNFNYKSRALPLFLLSSLLHMILFQTIANALQSKHSRGV